MSNRKNLGEQRKSQLLPSLVHDGKYLSTLLIATGQKLGIRLGEENERQPGCVLVQFAPIGRLPTL